VTLGTTFDQCMSLKSIFGSLFSIVFSLCVDIAFIFFVFLRVRLLRVGYSIKIAFRAKLEQEQGTVGYDTKFESTLSGVAAMSNRW